VFGALAKPAKHIPTTITGSLDCTTCHTTLTGAGIKVTSGAADWVKEKMNHNGATGSGAGGVYCVTCHLSGASYLGSADKKSHKGAGLPPAKDCGGVSGCHKPSPGTVGTLYTVWPNP
jgi:hypothetical protein